MATTNNQITAGTMTANKQQGLAATEVRQPNGINLTEGMGPPVGNELLHGNHLVTAGLAGYNLGKYGLGKVGQALDASRNAEIARVLMDPGMSGVNRLTAAPYQLPYAPSAIMAARNQMMQTDLQKNKLPLFTNRLLGVGRPGVSLSRNLSMWRERKFEMPRAIPINGIPEP